MLQNRCTEKEPLITPGNDVLSQKERIVPQASAADYAKKSDAKTQGKAMKADGKAQGKAMKAAAKAKGKAMKTQGKAKGKGMKGAGK
jgi:hypothetical protein